MHRLCLSILAFCLAAPALGADLEIILDRRDRSIEMFLSLPADGAKTTLGTDLSQIEGLTTGVDFSVLQNGTWTQGDLILAQTNAQIGATPALFEAMSMMVHPKAQKMPFADPFDALTAVSVCGVPVPDAPPALDSMHLYAGYIAYPVNSAQSLTLRLGNSAPIEVTVRDFGPQGARSQSVRLAPGERLTLHAPQRIWPLGLALGLSLLASLTFGALLWRHKKAPRPA